MATFEQEKERQSKKQYAYQYYINKGYRPIEAAAIVGNLDIESGGFSPDVVSGKRKGDNGSAFGLAQWRFDRQDRLNARYKNPKDFNSQLDFVDWELNNTHRDALVKMREASNVEEATSAFTWNYEKPNKNLAHFDKRVFSASSLLSGDAVNDVTNDSVNSYKVDRSAYIDPTPLQTETSTTDYVEPEEPKEVKDAKQDIAEKSFAEDFKNIISNQQEQINNLQNSIQQAPEQQEQFSSDDMPDAYNYIGLDPGYDFGEEQFQKGGTFNKQQYLNFLKKNKISSDNIKDYGDKKAIPSIRTQGGLGKEKLYGYKGTDGVNYYNYPQSIYDIVERGYRETPIIYNTPQVNNITQLASKGLVQQNNLSAIVPNIYTPAKLPEYYDVTDKVNQNFGGSETNYKWYPESNESLQELATEPYNTRKIIPHYQDGGKIKNERFEALKSQDNTYVKPLFTEANIKKPIRTEKEQRAKFNKLSKEQQEKILYNQYAEQHGDIKSIENQSIGSKTWEVLTHPMTAAGYVARNENIPDNFSRGEINAHETATNLINPFFYADETKNFVRNVATGHPIDASMNALNVLPLASEYKSLQRLKNSLSIDKIIGAERMEKMFPQQPFPEPSKVRYLDFLPPEEAANLTHSTRDNYSKLFGEEFPEEYNNFMTEGIEKRAVKDYFEEKYTLPESFPGHYDKFIDPSFYEFKKVLEPEKVNFNKYFSPLDDVEKSHLTNNISPFKNGGKLYQSGGKIKDERFEGLAQNDAIPKTKPITPVFPKYDDVERFMQEYIKSPKYQERLEKSGYKDPEEEAWRRLNLVEQTKTIYGESKVGSFFNPQTATITLDPKTDQEIFQDNSRQYPQYKNFTRPTSKVTKAHELGHAAIDHPEGSRLNNYDFSQMFNREKAFTIDPEQDYRQEEQELQRKQAIEDPNELPHRLRINEKKADLDALRYELKKAGIYNAGKEDFTKKHLDKLKKSPSKDRLLDVYTEDDLIWLMNNIAQNENKEYSSIARNGGIIEDEMGVWNNPGQQVVVPTDGNITMKPDPRTGKSIEDILMGISLETGEQKIMYPGEDYYFKNTKKVKEIPINKNRFR